ncbi:MAG: hypothetical protein AAF710_05370 [Planctomycetota bacterium]
MPPPDTRWWHLILTARGQWLPGDPRGFRSRRHRIHSSGDYKHHPPADEHQDLFRYHKRHAAPPVTFPVPVRELLGRALQTKTKALKLQCLCLAVGPSHAHMLLRGPADFDETRKIVGRLKQAASHAVRSDLPGRIWADGGKPIPIRDREHQLRVFRYILKHENEGAWVWRFDA